MTSVQICLYTDDFETDFCIKKWNPWWGTSPGADDNGSGSVTIFESLRVLVSSGFLPKKPLEFHWYAAEEGGLLGSQKVVAKYKEDGIDVFGM
jgi:leucyl aminopeptidase